MNVKVTADHAADQAADSDTLAWLARGLAARGVLWLVIGLLIIRIAAGDQGERADKQGALQTIADQPFGRFLLALVALGFLGYAAWRIVEAIHGEPSGAANAGRGTDARASNDDDGKKEMAKRIGKAARGVVYLFLFFTTLPLIFSSSPSSGSGNQQRTWTETVLGWPFGRLLVGLAGLAVIGAGVYNAYRGLTDDGRDDLDEPTMSPTAKKWAARIAVVGLVARAVVFFLVGYFLVKVAVDFDKTEPIGIDEALHRVAGATWGTAVLWFTAVGLILYAGFCFAQVKWRNVRS